MGSVGAAKNSSGVGSRPGQVTSYSEAGKAATNNVIRVMNFLGQGRPAFVDKVTQGYRVHYGRASESEMQDFANQIKSGTGIDIQYRIRSGYGRQAGTYDVIIPFSTDDEKLEYNRRR